MICFQNKDCLLILQECMLGFGLSLYKEDNNELTAWCWYRIMQGCKN